MKRYPLKKRANRPPFKVHLIPTTLYHYSLAFASIIKAIYFNDFASAKQILETDDVAEIKALGRGVTGFEESYWNGIRQIVVYEGLIAKFSQNKSLKKLLLGTGKDILAECAVKDIIWGIGVSMKDPDRFDKTKWKGQNLLGYALMMVRSRLR